MIAFAMIAGIGLGLGAVAIGLCVLEMLGPPEAHTYRPPRPAQDPAGQAGGRTADRDPDDAAHETARARQRKLRELVVKWRPQ